MSLGSNSWVINETLSKTNFPLLGSDPHTNRQVPSNFYLCALKYNNTILKGGTFPGTPLFSIGRN